MTITISVVENEAASIVEKKLLEDLHSSSQQSKNASFNLLVKSDSGVFIGGLSAHTSYGWLLIKTLFVEKSMRRRGTATALVKDAHARALNIGCHAAWLDTSNPRAKAFYETLGYIEFGCLENKPQHFPASHKRWFLQKSLIIA